MTNLYTVRATYSLDYVEEIEANSEEEALELAENFPDVCHQCADNWEVNTIISDDLTVELIEEDIDGENEED